MIEQNVADDDPLFFPRHRLFFFKKMDQANLHSKTTQNKAQKSKRQTDIHSHLTENLSQYYPKTLHTNNSQLSTHTKILCNGDMISEGLPKLSKT